MKISRGPRLGPSHGGLVTKVGRSVVYCNLTIFQASHMYCFSQPTDPPHGAEFIIKNDENGMLMVSPPMRRR